MFGSDQTLYIGSVKPNIGHGEGASGINSILKCILALEHRVIPPNIHFSEPNPKIAFEESRMVVPVETISWPKDRIERASVNCFGVGGANSHVILESLGSFERTSGIRVPPAATVSNAMEVEKEVRSAPALLVLSAADEESLGRSIFEHQQYSQRRPSHLQDLSYTLCRRREHLPFRAFCVTNGESIEFISPTKQDTVTRITMVFTGQGSQWVGMAKELIDNYRSFEKDIDELSRILSNVEDSLAWNIKDELIKPNNTSRLNTAEVSQPVTTAVQIALVNLLRRWDIYPSVVIGHSSGEIAAAYAAESITAEEAMLISYHRGQAATNVRNHGSMAAVGLGKDDALSYLEPGVIVACENSPSSVTLSGDKASLEISCERIKKEKPNTFLRHLKVDIAYHSRKCTIGVERKSFLQ